jgi:lipid II:glycine glycyltransferase (peptidoglycan interpeptide bridge formation enzyme)
MTATLPDDRPLRVEVDIEAAGREWDDFVAATPGGHHAQTSRWAQVKDILGWDAARVILRADDRIVAGAQVLLRPVGRAGKVAFVPRGPLLGDDDPRLTAEMDAALMTFARKAKVRYIKVQPPANRHDLVPALGSLGWTASAMEAAPSATVRIDLFQSEDELLQRMHTTTRRYVRQGPRRGLEIRTGGEADLPAYYRIVEATSRRQGFTPYPLRYYETMWREFARDGRATMLLAEHEGRLLSAVLVIGWGDSATYKMGGWLGERASVRPNEPIHWAAMRWAKAAGYRYYDFDGVAKSVAETIARGETLDHRAVKGVASFKLQFGGDVALFPGALDSSPDRLLKPVVRLAAPRMDRMLSTAHRLLGRGH